VVHYVLIPKWQEKLDGEKQKSVFLPLKVPKNDQNRVSEDWERVGRGSGPYDVINRAECLSLWSLSSVWATNRETYIFLVNIDIQWKLPTTEENAKIQLEAILKMCSFWVCRPWIMPKQRQQQSSRSKWRIELLGLTNFQVYWIDWPWRRSFQKWMVSTFMC